MTSELFKIIQDKLPYVRKEPLFDFMRQKGLKPRKTKDNALDALWDILNEEMAAEILLKLRNEMGFIGAEVESRLNITSSERRKWTKKGYLQVCGTYNSRAHGQAQQCFLYDLKQIMETSQEDIERWRKEKVATAAQLAGREKARVTFEKNRICCGCGVVKSYKKDLRGGLCIHCLYREKAYAVRRHWLANKDLYCILDTETTGLGYSDQVVEIAILDLDGNVLMDTLVMPTVLIDPEAQAVHGISMQQLVEKKTPAWAEVYWQVEQILNGRTMIAYNAEFDHRIIQQSCIAAGIEAMGIRCECLMENVMIEMNSKYRISLAKAAGREGQNHRAVDDCRMCLAIIQDNSL